MKILFLVFFVSVVNVFASDYYKCEMPVGGWDMYVEIEIPNKLNENKDLKGFVLFDDIEQTTGWKSQVLSEDDIEDSVIGKFTPVKKGRYLVEESPEISFVNIVKENSSPLVYMDIYGPESSRRAILYNGKCTIGKPFKPRCWFCF